MTHDEKRFLRREFINSQFIYWHEWARYFNYAYGKLTFVKNTVRSMERANYGQELNLFS